LKQETKKNIFSLPRFISSHHTVDLMFLYTFYLQLSLVTACCYCVAYMGRWPGGLCH